MIDQGAARETLRRMEGARQRRAFAADLASARAARSECHADPGSRSPSSALPFVSPAELRDMIPPEPPWVWRGYLARGGVTLFAGKPKAGKSTLAFAAAGAVAANAGHFLSQEVSGGPVIYVSEEGAATLAHKLPDSDGMRVLTRDAAWPPPDWPELVGAATVEARRVGAVLLVVDTLSAWAGLAAEREKDAGAAQAAMQPLLEAARAGLAVWLVHHARKGGGEGGEGVRGSSALAGAADIVLELDRPTGTAPPRERVLRAFSRYPQTPDALRFDHEATTASWRAIEGPEAAASELPLGGVWAAIRDEPGRSKRRVREAVTGNAGATDAALAWLVEEGYVEVRQEGQASRHYPLRPFPADRVQLCPDRAQTRFDTVSACPPSVGGDTRHGRRHEDTDTGTVGEQGA